MNEKVRAFYEAVSADDALQTELTAVTEGVVLEGVSEAEARQAMAEAVAPFAAEHDLDLTAEDILAADVEATEGELDDAELVAVAGGGDCQCYVIGAVKGCGCFIGGGGKNAGLKSTIGNFCFMAGDNVDPEF